MDNGECSAENTILQHNVALNQNTTNDDDAPIAILNNNDEMTDSDADEEVTQSL